MRRRERERWRVAGVRELDGRTYIMFSLGNKEINNDKKKKRRKRK